MDEDPELFAGGRVVALRFADVDVAASESAGSEGVCTSTVPIFDAAGQSIGLFVWYPNWASVQATRPLAEDGLMPIPSGSVTLAVFRYELAIASVAVERDADVDGGRLGRVDRTALRGDVDRRFERHVCRSRWLRPGW